MWLDNIKIKSFVWWENFSEEKRIIGKDCDNQSLGWQISRNMNVKILSRTLDHAFINRFTSEVETYPNRLTLILFGVRTCILIGNCFGCLSFRDAVPMTFFSKNVEQHEASGFFVRECHSGPWFPCSSWLKAS